MAKAVLPTNFKDDVLDSSMNGKRRYVLIQNSDGTYSLDDATQYTQVGSTFGQAQINATNKAVNDSVDKAVVIDNISDIAANNTSGKVAGALALKELNRDLGGLSFAQDSEGNWGYKIGGADPVYPFNGMHSFWFEINLHFSGGKQNNYIMEYAGSMYIKVLNGSLVGVYKDSTDTPWPQKHHIGNASNGSITAQIPENPTLLIDKGLFTFTLPVKVNVDKYNVYAGEASGNLVVIIDVKTKEISIKSGRVISGQTSSSFALVEISKPLLFALH